MSFGDGIAGVCADIELRRGKCAAWGAFIYMVLLIPTFGAYAIVTVSMWAMDEKNGTLAQYVGWQIRQVVGLLHRLW